jgi:hypothetical protein
MINFCCAFELLAYENIELSRMMKRWETHIKSLLRCSFHFGADNRKAKLTFFDVSLNTWENSHERIKFQSAGADPGARSVNARVCKLSQRRTAWKSACCEGFAIDKCQPGIACLLRVSKAKWHKSRGQIGFRVSSLRPLGAERIEGFATRNTAMKTRGANGLIRKETCIPREI